MESTNRFTFLATADFETFEAAMESAERDELLESVEKDLEE